MEWLAAAIMLVQAALLTAAALMSLRSSRGRPDNGHDRAAEREQAWYGRRNGNCSRATNEN